MNNIYTISLNNSISNTPEGMEILYTTEWCSACTSAKRLLESKGLEYEEVNIETQRISRSKLMELTGRLAVPTIVIDGKVIGGFESLQELL